jgi:hypothetical protein
VCKDAVHNLGANKTPKGLLRVGKIVGILKKTLENFEEQNVVNKQSGQHKVTSFTKDLRTVVKVLTDENIFKHLPGRSHQSFQNIHNLIQSIDHDTLKS